MHGVPNPSVDAEFTPAEIQKNPWIDGSALHAGQHDKHEKKETLNETLTSLRVLPCDHLDIR